jgi:phosphate transport system substrate-binding protein
VAATTEALKFFAWAYAKGGKMAEELVYVPMPEKVSKEVEAMWSKEIKDSKGNPLHVTSN